MSNAATQAQIDAALPKRSTWLSANAGSGKTRVLTDRVALLLLDSVLPQRILCLTYTKAAASEMQNRLFARLGAWAMMPEDALTDELILLGVPRGTINSEKLRDARRLFAKAIEAPGGLKIQTIHSFCAALLRRFPLEAGVSPAFTEMDDRAARELRAQVFDTLLEDQPDVAQPLVDLFSGDDPDELLEQISKQAELFSPSPSDAQLRALTNYTGEDTRETILSQCFLGEEGALVDRMMPVLRTGSTNDQKLADKLQAVDLRNPDQNTLFALVPLCLTSKAPFVPKANPPTKDTAAKLGQDFDGWDALRQRVADAREAYLSLLAYERARALNQFAAPYLERYARAKQHRSWLDFDDQIRKARALLSDATVASWVLFKLDGGIDHILVDEAQDTSPEQWDVIRLLSEEFFSGQGAREITRTVFVVGDKKQSIYSFQGADPAEFDRMRDFFESRHAAISAPFGARELLYSFRSAPPILQLVDAVFTPQLRKGMGEDLEHKAFKAELPGRVDLWDWVEKEDAPPEREWYDPVDRLDRNSPTVRLAQKIADQIVTMVQSGQITQLVRQNGKDRPATRAIEPRDILILVQSRTRQDKLFFELIRACKLRGLPMAGADRLLVGQELGVRDLISLLSFLETPGDDLALAEVMRSPLGLVSEAELYDLAYGRSGTLWEALQNKQADHPELFEMLSDLRDNADFLRPYELLERALTQHHGRARLLDRLGQEADDGITALLDLAIDYERRDVPSLTGFLTWLQEDDVSVKRELDTNANQIRVMTVHGAKGLEAPIVILPQTGPDAGTIKDDILSVDGKALWKSRSEDATAIQRDVIEEKKALRFQEYMRLLYVALTRAESWLILCGSGTVPTSGKSWYEAVEQALLALGAAPEDDVKLRLQHGEWPQDIATDASGTQTELTPLPQWCSTPLPALPTPLTPLSPSHLAGAKTLPGAQDGMSAEDAMQRGTDIHLLLETLAHQSVTDRTRIAERLLPDHDPQVREGLLTHAAAVLDAPELRFLFDETTMAEVGISARLEELGGRMISGSIDRLVITPERVLAVDFKSNIQVPERAEDTPDALLRQMGAYAAALRQIYPDREIELAIVWTQTATFMRLPHEIVRKALLETHIS